MNGACGDLRNGQTREDTTPKDQHQGNAQVQDQTGVLLRVRLLREREGGAAEWQGDGLDNGRKGVEQADQQHVDASQAGSDAIGRGGARASGADGGSHSCVST
jgi:hypothetical protein